MSERETEKSPIEIILSDFTSSKISRRNLLIGTSAVGLVAAGWILGNRRSGPFLTSSTQTFRPEAKTPTSPEVLKPSPIPTLTEKAPETGWKRFLSLNYPYQIDYPSEWTAQSSNLKVDIFLNNQHPPGLENLHIAGVNITIKPVESHVTLESYLNQRVNSLPNTAEVYPAREIYQLSGMKALTLQYRYPQGGVLTGDLAINFSNQISLPNSPITVAEVHTLKDRGIWRIQFASYSSSPDSNKFLKMLETFKFLK